MTYRSSLRQAVAITLALLLAAAAAGAKESDPLDAGIRQYQLENYEEAIDLLKKARDQAPRSAVAAFFLGMAYKQAMDYPAATEHLRDAVDMDLRIREALPELIDVLIQSPNPADQAEAMKWIGVAEGQQIEPAKIAFLKGQALQKQGRNEAAIAAFTQAKETDPGLTQAADFQIALTYLKTDKLDEAREQFRKATLQNPDSDLASFTRSYGDIVERRIFAQRPLRFKIRAMPFYDSNMVLKPTWDVAAAGITDESSWGVATALTAYFIPRIASDWLFSAQYAFFANFHENHADTHDVLANSISLLGGYDFGPFSLNLTGYYSNFLLGRPDYEHYLDDYSGGLMLRTFLTPAHALELFAGYGGKTYAQAPLIPEEDRDADGFRGYLNLRGLVWDTLFYNFQYEFIDENTEGENWDNTGHRFLLEATYPFTDTVRLKVSAAEFLQFFNNPHPLIDTEREDHTNIIGAELTWTFLDNTDLVLDYYRTRANSNVGIYDYKRHIVSLGIEYRF